MLHIVIITILGLLIYVIQKKKIPFETKIAISLAVLVCLSFLTLR